MSLQEGGEVSGVPRGGFAALRAMLPVTLAVIEFCWLYPWVLLFTGGFYGPAAPLLGPVSALAMLVLGFLTVRAALARPWSLRAARAGVVAVGLTAGLAVVKATYYPAYAVWDLRWIVVLLRAAHDALPDVVPPVMASLVATLLWWRGIVLGEREFTHFEIERAFRRGIGWTLVFVAFFVIYGGSRGFAAAGPAPAYLLAFFSLGLFMLAVTRLLAVWQEDRADEAQALAANRHWLLLLLGVVGLILSAAASLAGLVNVEFRPTVARWLAPLGPVVELLFLIVFAVAVVIAKAILAVLSHLPRRYRPLEPPPGLDQPLGQILRELPPGVVAGARWGMVVAVVALLLVLVAVAVVRGRRRAKKAGEDERESVWSTPLALSGLRHLLRSLWARLRPALGEQGPEAVGSIRAIYRELLRIGAALGIPRRPSETPYEYRPRLTERLAADSAAARGAAEVAVLTESYVRVRYTPHVPGGGEVSEARAALDRLRAHLQNRTN